MAVRSRPLWLVLAALGCSSSASEPARAPATATSQSPLTRTGIEGCNCAGAAPVLNAPGGAPYVFQSIVAYYYQSVQAFWTKIDGEDVLKTWLPSSIEASGEAFYAWQAKTVQIYRDRDLLGFAHRYYRGIFGFLAGEGTENACAPALDPTTRTTGMLAHVGLSQAGVCGKNDDGTTKFWQVNRIVLLMIGDVVDANALIDAGIGRAVQVARAEDCILPVVGPALVGDASQVPCRVAYRDDAVTEGIVLPVPTTATVDGVALVHRAFTAAGTVAMPNALDEVRKILRDGELRAMYAIGRPRFAPEPSAGPTMVRLIGHAVGPAATPNPVLLPEERAWVDATVGGYQSSCCHVACDAPAPVRITRSFAGFGGELYGDVPIELDAGLDPDVDAGIDAPVDAGRSFPDARVVVLDGGVSEPGGGSGVPPGGGSGVPPGGGSGTPPGGGSGSGTLPGGGSGSGTPPGGGSGSGTPPGGGSGSGAPPGGGSGSGTPPGDPPGPPGGGSGSDGPGCRMVCVPEGVCATASAGTGLVVMVSGETTKECSGNCPEPAADAPASAPTCAP